jgi:DNA repair protein RadC
MTDAKTEPGPAHAGHRGRLLDRFERNGLSSLHPHEIIELILSYAIPRRDTKPLARMLLGRFGSISGVLNASIKQFTDVPGIGTRTALLFVLMKDVLALALQEKFSQHSLISHRQDVYEYLRFHFGAKGNEYVAAMYLDTGNRVLATEILAEGTTNQCLVYPRKVIERALHHKATSLVLAHNHPGGSIHPSENDWKLTKRLIQIGKLLEMPLLDHVIISRDAVISLKEHPLWPS